MTSPRFPKFGSKRKATTKDLNRLIEWINGVIKFTVRGRGIRFTQGRDGVTITHKDEELAGGLVKVQTQEAWQTDGTVSVKRVDSTDTEFGEAFDVFILMTKDDPVTDVTSGFWPVIEDDQILWVARDTAGDWILVRPDVQENEGC